jgi:aminoglycoside phosphotransferase family enzyme/predicted kinase
MSRPDFYAHRPAAVTLVQTHISYVLLAGERVYKIKKAVRFTFLDFSTLERRRHFSHEEVRLNRRLAPDVYCGVLAVSAEHGAYRLTSEDDPSAVEYVIEMRRLPADRMLDQLLDRNAVLPALIDAIADRLAEFHRRADAGPAVTANGDPAHVLAVLEDNYANARPFRDVTIAAPDDDAIQRFARGFLRTHAALFRRRQAEQRIRDCHGDLHSEHICCTEPLVIFDCIEFNAQFRYCDVASEMAFLAMDLDYHAHPELAVRLVDRYTAGAADPDLRRLLPFYQCYRAYVRGKVDSLKSREEEVAPAERVAAQDSARRHFALAYRYTWAYSPALVAIAGLSGTGKSSVGAALHARTGFAHINSDVVRKRLAGVPIDAPSKPTAYDAGIYTPELSAQTYQAMLDEAARQVGARRGAILDATFQLRGGRDAARAVARQHDVPFLLVECRCDEGEVRRRLHRRIEHAGGPSDADWNVYLEQRNRFEPIGSDEGSDHLIVDTGAPAEQSALAIEAELVKRIPQESSYEDADGGPLCPP